MEIETLKLFILESGLGSKCRQRRYSYRRFYLYAYLRSEGWTCTAIAKLFNKTHGAVCKGIKAHLDLMCTGDEQYEVLTSDLMDSHPIVNELKDPQDRAPKSVPRIVCSNAVKERFVAFKTRNRLSDTQAMSRLLDTFYNSFL